MTLHQKIYQVINQENDRYVSRATYFLKNQQFALNANGIVIIENIHCYRVDSAGFWFTFNYVSHPTQQTYRVSWDDIEEVKDYGYNR